MATRDNLHILSHASTINPAAARTNATVNGTGVDLAGYESATVCMQVGAITDGTHTPTVQESDDNSTFTDVAAADLIGDATNPLAAVTSSATAGTVYRTAYIGSKRYIRLKLVTASATSGGFVNAWVVRGHARRNPA